MKLHGYRTDGALRIEVPGGMTVILRGDRSSPPIDDREADRLGPWIEPSVTLTGEERQVLARRLDRSRMAAARTFALADAPAAVEEKKKDAPMTKGDLLARINEIADAQAKAKDAKAAEGTKVEVPEAKADPAAEPTAKKKDEEKPTPPPMPRFGTKKLKLEYEVTNREGETIGTQATPGAKSPDANSNPENSKADESDTDPTPKYLRPFAKE